MLQYKCIRSNATAVPMYAGYQPFCKVLRFDGLQTKFSDIVYKKESFPTNFDTLVMVCGGVLFPPFDLVTMFGGVYCCLTAVGECHDLAHDSHVLLRPVQLHGIAAHQLKMLLCEL